MVTQSVSGAHTEITGEIMGSIPQIAFLNNLLPRGFRFESFDNARKLNASLVKSMKRAKSVICPLPAIVN